MECSWAAPNGSIKEPGPIASPSDREFLPWRIRHEPIARHATPNGVFAAACWEQSPGGRKRGSVNKPNRASLIWALGEDGEKDDSNLDGRANKRTSAAFMASPLWRIPPCAVDWRRTSNRNVSTSHRNCCDACWSLWSVCVSRTPSIPSAGSEKESESVHQLLAGQGPVGKRHASPLEILSGSHAAWPTPFCRLVRFLLLSLT